jgi:hypothetical protein
MTKTLLVACSCKNLLNYANLDIRYLFDSVTEDIRSLSNPSFPLRHSYLLQKVHNHSLLSASGAPEGDSFQPLHRVPLKCVL